MNWKPIETAPKDGTRFLAAWVSEESACMEIVFWNKSREAWSAGDGGWGTDRWRDEDSPEYWMELPEFPQ